MDYSRGIRMNEITHVDLPGFVLRSLHSGWTDWLVQAPEPVRDAMIERCTGVTFQRFALALMAQRLVVLNRLDTDTDELHLGIGVPVQGAPPWELFWLRSSHTGLDWSLMAGIATHNLDQRLAELLEAE